MAYLFTLPSILMAYLFTLLSILMAYLFAFPFLFVLIIYIYYCAARRVPSIYLLHYIRIICVSQCLIAGK